MDASKVSWFCFQHPFYISLPPLFFRLTIP
jgi:hypothetical protein